MAIVKTARPPVKSKPAILFRAHRWKLLRAQLVLEILTARKNKTEIDRYLYEPLAADFGVAFRLTKVDALGEPAPLDDDAGEFTSPSYDIHLSGVAGGTHGTAHGTCECPGYLRHGHCKHVETGWEMLAAGEIGGVP